MRRKTLGALLLPLPFAALPVIVVLIGAVFGPGESDDVVTREDPVQVIEDFASTQASPGSDVSLARASTSLQSGVGCADKDLRSES